MRRGAMRVTFSLGVSHTDLLLGRLSYGVICFCTQRQSYRWSDFSYQNLHDPKMGPSAYLSVYHLTQCL